MRVIECEQGTPEWLEARLGIPTASEFSKIITSKGDKSASLSKYALELASQLMVDEQDPTYSNDIMLRGNMLEDEARLAYQEQTLNIVDEIGFFRLDNPACGYSPDGLVGNDGLIEIKCINQRDFTKVLSKKEVPSDYVQQIQGGMYVTGRKWCDFVAYHPNFKDNNKVFIKRVIRDDEYIEKLSQLIEEVLKKRDEIIKKIED